MLLLLPAICVMFRLVRLLLMAYSKESPLFKYFCTAMSEAVFQVLPGERERVTAHLGVLGMSEEQIRRVPRRYWRRNCRCVK